MGLLDLLGLRRKPQPEAAPAPKRDPAPAAVATTPGHAGDPLAPAHRAIEAYAREMVQVTRVTYMYDPGPRHFESGRRLLEAPVDEQVRIVMAAVERFLDESSRSVDRLERQAAPLVVQALLRRKLPFAPGHLARMLEVAAARPLTWEPALPVEAILSHVEQAWKDPAARDRLRPPLERLRANATPFPGVVATIDTLLTGETAIVLAPEPWTARIAADLAEMDDGLRPRWTALLKHLQGAGSARASAKWLKEARRLRSELGGGELRARAFAWLDAVREGADRQVVEGDLARGFVWLLADGGGEDEARALGDLALVSAKMIPGVGQRSLKIMNACLAALGEIEHPEGVAQISRLRSRVKQANPRKLATAALIAAAERRGTPMEELEEIVVPTFGMDEPGVLREEVGDWTAEVRIVGTADVETAWIRPDGKRQKSPPAELKAEHGDTLKELKSTAAEMEKMLAAQRDRLEGLPMAGRVVPFGPWRERYLDHSLLAGLSRRLVWRFETGDQVRSGAWLHGRIVDADDAPVDGLGDTTTVRLWHPIDASVDEVAAWRGWLERHGVTQPFKQAHREIYLLTDAERTTRSYSNRFAAHILKQHQFAQLARGRGWQYQLMGFVDTFSIPTLRLERHGLVVEYLVEAVLRDNDTSFMSRYVTTDQVRFSTLDGARVMLEDVPPLVFSEVMRDVDLFVGVASVGADPEWGNRGQAADARWGAYWGSYAFGDLSASAVTRREVLERLVPRLKIAKVCSLDGRFLVVRGRLRTYKIHLGSGNILMEPNDQYLCIVPDRSDRGRVGGDRLVLPFEGDGMLSVILSKAFLLADDTSITDETILRQIRVK